ncbi:uncharacterized protein LOC129944848 [Eupeodes corollae]|uniref:uncharacterized protein LOC129944848 n=1 Tax=Eupeodes corollae TaxID=290404 RepID=UPI0024937400|nr:uncharacterized protein LOC129944848 [Eupeodes corollae]
MTSQSQFEKSGKMENIIQILLFNTRMNLRTSTTYSFLSFLLFLRIYNGQKFKLETEVIEKLYQESDSATVLFIGSESEFLSEFIRSHNNIPVSVFCANGTPTVTNAEDSLQRFILVVHSSKETTHKQSWMNTTLLEFIPKMASRKHVIIVSKSIENLSDYFSFFWKHNFTRIFGITRNTLYGYLPFANEPIKTISTNDIQLLDALKDFNGFSMRTIFRKDFPRIFRYVNKQGSVEIGGIYGKIFLNFLHKYNGTFREIAQYKNTTVQLKELIHAISTDEVDLVMNLYHPMKGARFSSYPIDVAKSTFMVPINGVVGANEYFMRPFSIGAWLCIGLMFIYIIVMDVFREILVGSTVNLWESSSRIFLMMLRLPTECQITTGYRFHIQVLLLSFVLGNLYTVYFTSFLTVFIKTRQYETVQDLIDSNLKVLLVQFEWEFIKGLNILPSGFEKIAIPVDFYTLAKERDSMRNTSFAYSVGSDKGNFLISLQAHVTKPQFRLLPEHVMTAFVCVLMPQHSPLKDIFDRFIMQIAETGLYNKWRNDAIFQVFHCEDCHQTSYYSYRLNFEDVNRKVPLTLYHLKFAWEILIFGLTSAVFVFLGELVFIRCVWF